MVVMVCSRSLSRALGREVVVLERMESRSQDTFDR
jgi:hypothetical protein